jgi:hypothetical protein
MNALGVSRHFFLSCRPNGKAYLHNISRHADPKVQSENHKPNPQPQTATARHEQLRRDERIGDHALKIPTSSSSTNARRDMHQIPDLTMAALPQIRCLRDV